MQTMYSSSALLKDSISSGFRYALIFMLDHPRGSDINVYIVLSGVAGLDGFPGTNGKLGLAGVKGARGEPGPKGFRGPEGPKGNDSYQNLNVLFSLCCL